MLWTWKVKAPTLLKEWWFRGIFVSKMSCLSNGVTFLCLPDLPFLMILWWPRSPGGSRKERIPDSSQGFFTSFYFVLVICCVFVFLYHPMVPRSESTWGTTRYSCAVCPFGVGTSTLRSFSFVREATPTSCRSERSRSHLQPTKSDSFLLCFLHVFLLIFFSSVCWCCFTKSFKLQVYVHIDLVVATPVGTVLWKDDSKITPFSMMVGSWVCFMSWLKLYLQMENPVHQIRNIGSYGEDTVLYRLSGRLSG